jgi:hypothetical protein
MKRSDGFNAPNVEGGAQFFSLQTAKIDTGHAAELDEAELQKAAARVAMAHQ